jgi:hypothetical protein
MDRVRVRPACFELVDFEKDLDSTYIPIRAFSTLHTIAQHHHERGMKNFSFVLWHKILLRENFLHAFMYMTVCVRALLFCTQLSGKVRFVLIFFFFTLLFLQNGCQPSSYQLAATLFNETCCEYKAYPNGGIL